MRLRRATLAFGLLLVFLPLGRRSSAAAQEEAAAREAQTGLEIAGLPALGYDSDEGYGYGALAELYQHGDGTRSPYVWTLQPRIYLTTRGRRDLTVFFDAPALLSEEWRVSGYLGIEKRGDAPYYGVGNSTPYDASLDDPDGPDPHFYAFGRLRRIARVDLQRRIAGAPLRALFGVGLASTELDPVPRDEGSTLLSAELGSEVREHWTNFVRAGLVWDTRDRETAPRSGTWSEVLVQRVDESFGADVGFTRWTLVHRRYESLGDRLVFAHRYLLQGITGDAPIDQLQRIETSFREGEGLGGSSSVRGLLKNRYTGKGLLIWNAELRLRVLEFRMIGRRFHGGVSAFLDHGRVWSGAPRLSELFKGLHRGYGGGLHGGMGETFVASLYAGTSAETGLQVYVGLGYLF